MFLKFEAPDRHDVIVDREDISVISGEFLYTRSGQRFRIYPIDGQELKRFGLVSVPPAEGAKMA